MNRDTLKRLKTFALWLLVSVGGIVLFGAISTPPASQSDRGRAPLDD